MITIDLISPLNNDINVSSTTEVVFRVYDDTNLPVVDTTKINVYQVYPNSVPAILAGVFVNGWTGQSIETTALTDYTIVVIPPSSIPDYGSGVRVHFTLEYEEL